MDINPCVYAVSQKRFFNILAVTFSDGSVKFYDVVALGCDWFRMSNDAFYNSYGFNFTPYNVSGLYEHCRKLVYGK